MKQAPHDIWFARVPGRGKMVPIHPKGWQVVYRFVAGVLGGLQRYHRDHEKFYAQEPRAQSVVVQRHARALQALADRWTDGDAGAPQPSVSPFEGSVDLNADVAVQLDGILFMEGEGEPTEIARIDKAVFLRLVQRTPEFALDVMQKLTRRLRRMTESL